MDNEDIRNEILKHGRIPLFEKEGLIKLLEYHKKIYGAFDHGKYDPSRKIKLNDFKKPIDEDLIEDDRINLRYLTILELKAKIINMIEKEGIINFINNLPQGYSEIKKQDVIDFLDLTNESIFELCKSEYVGKYPQKSFTYKIFSESDAIAERIGSIHNLPYGNGKNNGKYNSSVSDYRIYINTPNGKNRYEFLYLYRKKCIERNIPYEMKGEVHTSEDYLDRTVLYIFEDHLNETIKILEEISKENPKLISTFGSPITSGINYNYYSITHGGYRLYTYNTWANRIISRAINCYIANLIINDNNFFSRFPNEEQEELLKISKVTEHGIKLRDSVALSVQEPNKFTLKYFDSNFSEILKDSNLNLLYSIISKMASLSNFGDLEHSNCSIALPSLFYGIMPKRTEDINNDSKSDKDIYLYHIEDLFEEALQDFSEEPLSMQERVSKYIKRTDYIYKQFRYYAFKEPGFISTSRYAEVKNKITKLLFKGHEPDDIPSCAFREANYTSFGQSLIKYINENGFHISNDIKDSNDKII